MQAAGAAFLYGFGEMRRNPTNSPNGIYAAKILQHKIRAA
jgi:hypothetical protein